MDGPSSPAQTQVPDEILKRCGVLLLWIGVLILVAAELYRAVAIGAAFGGTALLGARVGPPGLQQLLAVSAIAGIVEMLATLAALYWLMRFMVTQLFPIFFSQGENPRQAEGPTMLYCAFGSLLVGFGAQVLANLYGLVLRIAG